MNAFLRHGSHGRFAAENQEMMMLRKDGLNRRSIGAWAASAAIALAIAVTPAAAAGSGEAAVLAANAGFYAALNKMFIGDAVPMEAVWSHKSDVTYMGPTGKFEHGWSEVLKNWQSQAAMKLGGTVAPDEMQAFVGRDLAVVSEYEVGENTNADGKVAQLKLRATNVFRLEHGKWKMVGHHTDTLPYLAK